jgi:hypothetical protein
MPRFRRLFSSADREALLDALAACRRACTNAQATAPINGPIYRACGTVTGAIDDLAGVLTGNREHLWTPLHGKPKKEQM